MQDFDRLNRIAKRLQERYPRGTRIVLLSMGNDPNPILPGTRGTVNVVDDIATVHCTFDNGRTLGIAYGEDSFRALTAEELAEESECEDHEQVGGMHLCHKSDIWICSPESEASDRGFRITAIFLYP